MKKFISLVLAAAMVLSMTFVLAGCGDKDDAGADGLKIVGVVATALGDKSFNDSAKEGLDRLKDEGYDTSIVECNGDSGLWEQNLRNAADTADMVFAVGSELNMI